MIFAPNPPMTVGSLDLSFLSSLEKSDLENDFLQIAAVDGDTLLEKSDFNKKGAKSLVEKLGFETVPPKDRLSLARQKLIEGKVKASLPQTETADKIQLQSYLSQVMEDSGLDQIYSFLDTIKPLWGQNFYTDLNDADRFFTLYTLMILQDSVHFNATLLTQGDQIDENYSAIMTDVVQAIVSGQVKVKFDEKDGADAYFLPDASGDTVGTIFVNEMNEDRFTLVHEAIHANQSLKKTSSTRKEHESEAYLMSASYQGLKLGFDVALADFGKPGEAHASLASIYQHQMNSWADALNTADGRLHYLYNYLNREIIIRGSETDTQYEALKLVASRRDPDSAEAIQAQEELFQSTLDRGMKASYLDSGLELTAEHVFDDNFARQNNSIFITYGDGRKEKVPPDPLDLKKISQNLDKCFEAMERAQGKNEFHDVIYILLQAFEACLDETDMSKIMAIADKALDQFFSITI